MIHFRLLHRLAALMGFTMFNPALASNGLEVEVGAYFASAGTSIEVYDPFHNKFIDLSFESELNLPDREILPYFDLEYRFKDNHQVYFDWRKLDRLGHQAYVARPFQLKINNSIYTIGGEADLDTTLNIDIMRLGYGYRFFQSEKLDVHFLSGFHVTHLKFGMSGKIDVDFDKTPLAKGEVGSAQFDTGVTAPLPNVGFLIEHRIRNDILLKSHVHAFYMSYGEISGWMYELEMAARYYITKDFSVTSSFNYYDLGVGYEAEHTQLKVDYRFFGPMVKFAYNF